MHIFHTPHFPLRQYCLSRNSSTKGIRKKAFLFKIAHISSKASFFHPRGTLPHCPPSEDRSSEL
jgi:hypothetical protein